MVDDLAAINKALRVSESRYRRVFETAKDGILLLNATTAQIEDVNPFLAEMLGYSHDEFLGKKIWEIGAFKDTALNIDAFRELQTEHYIRYDDLPLVAKSGQTVSVEFVSNVYDCDGVEVIQCNVRDNTKRHLAEIAFRATTRAFNMLSESGAALLSAESENGLFVEYCRIAVDIGGYRMAWVGVAESGPDKKVKPIAHFGCDEEHRDLLDSTWDETERGNGPTGKAIRSRQVQVVADISADPSMTPWRSEALRCGFKSSIAVPFQLRSGTMACLTLYSVTSDLWSAPERKLLQQIADDLAFGIDSLQTAVDSVQFRLRLENSLEQTIQVIADTVEERDPYTAGHQKRVAALSKQIATELGLSADQIHGLHLAASIHDLGKIRIPAEILTKNVSLSTTEFRLIKEHPTVGSNILKRIAFPWPIAEIILQHHERIDGSGYPQGLKRDQLLPESRVLAVADVVEAIATHRPYRAALGIETALSKIREQRGISLDEQVVDACLRLFHEQGYKIEDMEASHCIDRASSLPPPNRSAAGGLPYGR